MNCEKCFYKDEVVNNICSMSSRSLTEQHERECFFFRDNKMKASISVAYRGDIVPHLSGTDWHSNPNKVREHQQ